ncbi:MAG: hypothetical protein ACM3IJ_02075 [Candidatus Levyibacteriota bacterium]
MNSLLKTLFRDRLDRQDIEKFITFENEEYIFAAREHYITLLFRISQMVTSTFFVSIVFTVISFFVLHSILIAAAFFFVSLMGGFGIVIKEMVHWYFHLYIVTSRKLLEVRYSPLLSEVTSSVLLDQVRCTEIDADLSGIISEHLNMGNVSITFDRPTHEDIFVLRNIRSPRKVANLLSSQLHKTQTIDVQSLWVKDQQGRPAYVGRVPYGYLTN